MKTKRYLPQIITFFLSAVILTFGFISYNLKLDNLPFTLMEKLGIYVSDSGNFGILNNSFSVSSFGELYLSVIKNLAFENTLSLLLFYGIYSVFLAFVLAFSVKSSAKTKYGWTNYLCAVILPLVFCDFSNTVYFKTMYDNSLVLILLLLICSLFLNIYKSKKSEVLPLVLLFLSAVSYSSINNITALTSIVLGVLIIMLEKNTGKKPFKIMSVVFGLLVIAQSTVFVFSYKSPDYERNLYNSVFYGVCKYDSVTSLGLDENLDDFKEVYYGMKENEEEYNLKDNFYSKITYKDIVLYYAKHPVNAVKVLNNEARASFFNDYKFGFTGYSTLKKLYIPSGLLYVFGIAVCYVLVCIFIGKKHKNAKKATGLLCGISVMWLLSLIGTTIINGNCDITKNVYIFNVLFDILFVSAVVGGIRIMLEKRDENKEKFGITHE